VSPGQQQAQIVGDLSILPDAFERLNHLVAQANKADAFPPAERRPSDMVEGCQAELWLTASAEGEHIQFRSHSDAPTVAALAALFCSIYSGCSGADIRDFEPTVLEDTGLNRALTPNRQNGARQIVAKIKAHALAAQ
jgi:cysteine desulfuration protein SufE